MANWSTRRAKISAILLIATLVLGVVPVYMGMADTVEQPSKAFSSHSQSAVLQSALSKVSPQRFVSAKRLFRVDFQAESSIALVLLGCHVAFTEAESSSAGERVSVPIRAPPPASIYT
jgi:hypothetical protein